MARPIDDLVGQDAGLAEGCVVLPGYLDKRTVTIEFGAVETCSLANSEVDMLVKTLYRERRLSKNELRLILRSPVIDWGNDSLLEAVGPAKRDFVIARIGIAVVMVIKWVRENLDWQVPILVASATDEDPLNQPCRAIPQIVCI